MSDKIYISPDDVFTASRQFAQYAKDNGIKSIIGVARGGVIPAILAARFANLPYYEIRYSSKNGKGDDKNHDNAWFPIDAQFPALIVEDIADSGETLKELERLYKGIKVPIKTAVICYKAHEDIVHMPDIWYRSIRSDSGWVIFPWEE